PPRRRLLPASAGPADREGVLVLLRPYHLPGPTPLPVLLLISKEILLNPDDRIWSSMRVTLPWTASWSPRMKIFASGLVLYTCWSRGRISSSAILFLSK